MSIPQRKGNEAILDEKMTAKGHTRVSTVVNGDGSSTATYQAGDEKFVQVRVRADIPANPA
jgi:hypothetical protein